MCGAFDTPELWRGAAGLCTRVCTRVLVVPPNIYLSVPAAQKTGTWA